MANPFVAGPAPENAGSTVQELPTFTEYDGDFDHDCFRYDSAGSHITVVENDALKVWVYKLLKTPRYRYQAYYDDYGLILEDYIGKTPNDGAEASNLFAEIKKAILVNPYIKDVVNSGMNPHEKTVQISLELTTIYGKFAIEVEV